jgi:uncharacterized metal-binding protein
MRKINRAWMFFMGGAILVLQGCTVKAVGDPNRPITINAHITIDVKGLEKTANSIEDYVSGAPAEKTLKTQGGK